MKITNLEKKLKKLGIDSEITVEARKTLITGRFTGYNVTLKATHGDAEIVAYTYVDINEIEETDKTAIELAKCDEYLVKIVTGESRTSGFGFYKKVKSLDRILAS